MASGGFNSFPVFPSGLPCVLGSSSTVAFSFISFIFLVKSTYVSCINGSDYFWFYKNCFYKIDYLILKSLIEFWLMEAFVKGASHWSCFFVKFSASPIEIF